MRLATLGLVAAVTATACAGDGDAPNATCSVFPTPDTAPTIQQLGAALCEPGALSDVDLTGAWLAYDADGGPEATVGFQRECGTLVANGFAEVHVTADYAYWQHEYGTTFKVCRAEPDGTLRGYASDCTAEEPCPPHEIELRRRTNRPNEPAASGVTLLGTLPVRDGRNVRVHGDVAFVIARDTLHAVDVSNPKTPIEIGTWSGQSETLNDVKVWRGADDRVYAVVSSNGLGAVVLDVTHGGLRELRRFSPGTRGGHTVFVETDADSGQTLAYFADGITEEIPIFDLTDPSRPRAVGRYVATPNVLFHDLYVEDHIIYGNGAFEGLHIVDAGDPARPVLLGVAEADGYSHSNWVTTVDGRKVSVFGNEGTGSSISILDVDPDSETFTDTIGAFAMEEEVSVHNIMAFGDRAYVAYYQNGLRILDLSDPTAPAEVGHFNSWDPDTARGAFYEGAFGLDVDLDAGLVYLIDSETGLHILQLD